MIVIGLSGYWLGTLMAKRFKPKTGDEMAEMQEDSREALSERTEDRKEKILGMMEDKKNGKGGFSGCSVEEGKEGIVRTDVEKLLDVSRNTADKYLDELEKDGKVEQVGSGTSFQYLKKDV